MEEIKAKTKKKKKIIDRSKPRKQIKNRVKIKR